jgi:hypothetical protein
VFSKGNQPPRCELKGEKGNERGEVWKTTGCCGKQVKMRDEATTDEARGDAA